jgi:monolysocardiolipin acyltransferase
MMNEDRGFPRLLPRPGARLSITVGQPLTSRIQPLVDQWRELASKETGIVGLGGDWEKGTMAGDDQRELRGRGEVAGGREEDVRVGIVQVLQDALKELGEKVEDEEGRFARKEWSQSRPWMDR